MKLEIRVSWSQKAWVVKLECFMKLEVGVSWNQKAWMVKLECFISVTYRSIMKSEGLSCAIRMFYEVRDQRIMKSEAWVVKLEIRVSWSRKAWVSFLCRQIGQCKFLCKQFAKNPHLQYHWNLEDCFHWPSYRLNQCKISCVVISVSVELIDVSTHWNMNVSYLWQ